jgi:hypothetical protein
MATIRPLARIGAVAFVVGVVLLLVSTLLHPLGADPADAAAAFAEYAAAPHYVWTHLGQLAGFCGLSAGLVALAATLEPGWAAAWGRIGATGAVASVAVASVLQVVDGVALKATVDRWAAAEGAAHLLAFEAALALRQLEIGLAGASSILSGLTLGALGLAILGSARYPPWLGAAGLLDALGLLMAGAAQASTGFSDLAMALSMLSSAVLLVWACLAAFLMWRLAASEGEG